MTTDDSSFSQLFNSFKIYSSTKTCAWLFSFTLVNFFQSKPDILKISKIHDDQKEACILIEGNVIFSKEYDTLREKIGKGHYCLL